MRDKVRSTEDPKLEKMVKHFIAFRKVFSQGWKGR